MIGAAVTKPPTVDPNRASRRYIVRDAKGRFVVAHTVAPGLWDLPEQWSVTIGTAEDAARMEREK